MLKLVIGNKAYSSWSMRGWLAVKQSGLAFEEVVVPMDGAEWAARLQDPLFARSGGKVPILVDGDTIVWDSFAILEWLADKAGPQLYWPEEETARAMARSIAAEMHSSYAALRTHCSMNVRRRFEPRELPADAQADIARITALWEEARSRYGSGGRFLFGAFGAADIMFAPVVTRFDSYAVPLSGAAAEYRDTMMDHVWMREWIDAAHREPWTIPHYEPAEDRAQ
jgi:glutathione S-transferase